MSKNRRILIFLIVLTLISLFLVFPISYAINAENPSDEIEKIEYEGNTKITYFKNGTRKIEIYSALNINVATSAGTAHVVPGQVPPPIIPISEILDVIHFLVGIITGILAIFGRKIYIHRKKKPDYVAIIDKTKKGS